MIEFDKQLWCDRATNRFKRAASRPATKTQKVAAAAQWYNDVVYIDKLGRVIDWCKSKNLKIRFGKIQNGIYLTADRTIKLAGRAAPEKQLYVLLHECGHHLIGCHDDDERFGMGYPSMDDSDINVTFHHRITCLDEEMEAWRRAWRLGIRLDLQLDRSLFDKTRLDCLRSYIKWVDGRSKLTLPSA